MDEIAKVIAIVEAVQQRLMKAWCSGSATALADVYSLDADFVNVMGMYVQGRPNIAAMHQKVFDGVYAGSTNTLHTERVSLLADGVILAQVSTEVNIPSGTLQGIARGFVTMVLVNTDGEWLIRSFQNTRREVANPN